MDKNNNKINEILLVYSHLNTGGIETLIVRMVKWLARNNYNVTLFLYQDRGHLLSEIEELDNLNVIVNNKSSKLIKHINIFFLINKYLKNKDFDLVYSFTPFSLLLSYLFKTKTRLSGVYHPLEYHNNYRKDIINSLYKVDANFADNLISMNTAVKESTEKHLEEKLNEYIFPIPINISKNNKILGSQKSKKLISIGRIVDFKTYNFYMVDVMEKLVDKYPDLTYHIYGYGSEENKLIKKIENSSVKGNIFFHGRIDYNKISEVLKESFCFIGMGTSLLESCSFGVPGITAIINDKKRITPGFFHSLPGYILGSESVYKKEFLIEEKIEEILKMDSKDYNKICQKSKEKAYKFDIDNVMNKFMNYTISCQEKDEINNEKKINFLKYFYLKLERKIKKSLLK